MTREEVQRWLDAYLEAWKTYDPERIRDLFAENVEYRYNPYSSKFLRGQDAVVASWLEDEEGAPGTYDATYEPYLVDGDAAVATGSSRYYTDASRETLDKEYFNAFLLRFDGEGRCKSFTEYFMLRPAPKP